MIIGHEHEADEQPRHRTADEQVSDRRVGHERVENHRDRGRDDRADDRGRRRDRRGIARRVTVVLGHQVDRDLAGAGRVGNSRPRHARKDDADDDVHMTETTAKPADQRDAELVEAGRDRTRIHDVRGDDEQRHGEDHETVVEALDDLFRGEAEILSLDQQIGDRRDDHAERDRRAERREAEHGGERDGESEAHVRGSPSRTFVGTPRARITTRQP